MWIATFDRLIKLKSTLFVLPLTLAGGLLPFAFSAPVWDPWRWVAVVLGFVCARTAGMAFNEWIDKEIDAKNARTLNRVLPRGEMPIWQVATIAWASLALFVLIALSLGKALFIASLILSSLIALYSYTKRITSLCHFILGAILGAGPVMAYLAITGAFSPLALILGFATFCSLSACDIVYAIQDYQFDRIEGLRSVPALLGIERSKRLARLLHGFSLALLILLGIKAELGPLYYFGLALLLALLIRFHILVSREAHASVNLPKAPAGGRADFLWGQRLEAEANHDWLARLKPKLPRKRSRRNGKDFRQVDTHYTRLFFRCNVAFSNLTFLSILGGLLWRI